MTCHIELPNLIIGLVDARNSLRVHYAPSNLSFTLDGNLVGDIGEALAHEAYGLVLEGRSSEGIDGVAPDGRTVQVKASGTGRGPAFRQTRIGADHLLFFHLDFEACRAEVVYDGPESYVIDLLPANWTGQRMASVPKIRNANLLVTPEQRLPRIS